MGPELAEELAEAGVWGWLRCRGWLLGVRALRGAGGQVVRELGWGRLREIRDKQLIRRTNNPRFHGCPRVRSCAALA